MKKLFFALTLAALCLTQSMQSIYCEEYYLFEEEDYEDYKEILRTRLPGTQNKSLNLDVKILNRLLFFTNKDLEKLEQKWEELEQEISREFQTGDDIEKILDLQKQQENIDKQIEDAENIIVKLKQEKKTLTEPEEPAKPVKQQIEKPRPAPKPIKQQVSRPIEPVQVIAAKIKDPKAPSRERSKSTQHKKLLLNKQQRYAPHVSLSKHPAPLMPNTPRLQQKVNKPKTKNAPRRNKFAVDQKLATQNKKPKINR